MAKKHAFDKKQSKCTKKLTFYRNTHYLSLVEKNEKIMYSN